MAAVDQPLYRNRLLASLPREELSVLVPHLELHHLRRNEVLARPGTVIQHAYFLEDGLSLETADNNDGKEMEVGCVGREGMTPSVLIFGLSEAHHENVVLAEGAAWRMATEHFHAAFRQSAAFRGLLLRYAHTVVLQVAQTGIAGAHYDITRRLARWILMCQDRVGDQIHLTHETICKAFGVRRAGVTGAMHILEGDHAIKAERNLIIIRDRKKLVAWAGGSYGRAEAAYEKVIG
jgi:CRP-like cAMP-binding protein